MQLVPDGTFRKVRNNIDRLFDKNLTDLIRGIRNNKENEARYIAACIDEIKVELRQDSIFVKANAIEKLAYLQMLGYDISWAAFNIIEVMSSTRYSEKRIGYLAAVQAFNDETDVLMLTTNLIRKDLQSSNIYDVGVALSGLSCFTTTDLARDLVNDVVNLLSSSKPYVRKKAILLLYKIFLKYPESLRPTFARLRDRLEDQDPGVQSAAVNVVCELARKNPRNYLGLQSVFFKLLNTSSNNWMLIKIIKLFGSLVPHEPKLGRKLLEPLTNLINSTSAMSLLYECINTVIAILISISSEGPGDYTPSIQLCVQKLGILIDDSDQNLKYLGLLAMGKILLTHPKAVQAHKDIVLRCLDDKDESIRLRALDLLYGMVSKKNIMEIVRRLMDHVDAAEGSFYRDELLRRIIAICSHDNYKYITNFEWYISVLVELTKVEGSKHGILIAEQIQDVTVRVQSIRHFSVSQMALLVENAQPLLKGNGGQRNNVAEVLLAAAWICGEFAQHVNNVTAVLDAMLRIKLSVVPGPLLSVFVQNIAKLYTFQLCKLEADDDWDGIETLDNLLTSKLPEYQYTDHLEAQERTCNLIAMLNFASKMHTTNVKIGEALTKHFDGELNPVAAKAQRKVPVPDGLNLDECINEIEDSSMEDEMDEEEYDEEEEEHAQKRGYHDGIMPTSTAHRQNDHQQQHYAIGHSSSSVGRAKGQQKHREQSPDDAYHAGTGGANNGTMARATGSPSKSGGGTKKLQHKGMTMSPPTMSAREREESRRRRQDEQQHNPYYVKERPTRLLSADANKNGGTIGIGIGGTGGGASNNSVMKTVASVEQLQQHQQGIQSPLEIAGVLGLERYMQQRGSTLSWKEASKQKRTTTMAMAKKKGRMAKGSKKQQQQQNNGTTTTTMAGNGEENDDDGTSAGADGTAAAQIGDNNNDDDNGETVTTTTTTTNNGGEGGGGRRKKRDRREEEEQQQAEEQHFVYKGDGEMPEGALSSPSEEEADNEYRALDVGDLDEALREREQMLRAYAATTATSALNSRVRSMGDEMGKTIAKKGSNKKTKKQQPAETNAEEEQQQQHAEDEEANKPINTKKLGKKKKTNKKKCAAGNGIDGDGTIGGTVPSAEAAAVTGDGDAKVGQIGGRRHQQQVEEGTVVAPRQKKKRQQQQHTKTATTMASSNKAAASISRDDYTSIEESTASPPPSLTPMARTDSGTNVVEGQLISLLDIEEPNAAPSSSSAV
ncbi:hypothetical protein niasHT_017505 [Heterodera trifolii]|uniref:AP-3 complex subunit delta n=1 Tax=Heterodera trifolii TaxID=157864 RepID=A0ABD2L5X2_9BILA